MSESDESGGEESPPDSGSDWSQAGMEAAAEAAEAAAEDDHDDVSMADDSDIAPGSADASKENGASRKRRKPSPLKVPPKKLTMRNRANFAKAHIGPVLHSYDCVAYSQLRDQGVTDHLRGRLIASC